MEIGEGPHRLEQAAGHLVRGGTTQWRQRWMATVAGDVDSRDGLGWEFADFEQRDVWCVFREDGGPFPVFSSARGDGLLPSRADLRSMTREAVADLLAAADSNDHVGWITDNITAGLLLASCEVESWEGEEWALESDPEDVAANSE